MNVETNAIHTMCHAMVLALMEEFSVVINASQRTAGENK